MTVDHPVVLRQLVETWRAEADEIEADGDICCALTRRHDADALDAALLAGAVVPPPPDTVDEIVRRVAELPDRTSPDDWPEAMLVTADELRDILQSSGVVPPPEEGWLDLAPLEARLVAFSARHPNKNWLQVSVGDAEALIAEVKRLRAALSTGGTPIGDLDAAPPVSAAPEGQHDISRAYTRNAAAELEDPDR